MVMFAHYTTSSHFLRSTSPLESINIISLGFARHKLYLNVKYGWLVLNIYVSHRTNIETMSISSDLLIAKWLIISAKQCQILLRVNSYFYQL